MTHRKSPPSPGRPHQGAGLIYGAHAVLSALANPQRRPVRLWATDNAAKRHRQAIETSGIALETAKPHDLARKVGDQAVHQGLVLEAAPLPDRSLEDLRQSGPLVVLDQVTDPHNVGAILRSAAAFGAEAIVMTARNAPQISGLIAKAASGAVEHVAVIRVTNLARALGEMADLGYQRIGLDGAAEVSLDAISILPPAALVLGAEGKGLRELTARHCDHLARLDLPGPIKSLNVSNAAALALHIAASR